MCWSSVLSVCYTHLDVYKRQNYLCFRAQGDKKLTERLLKEGILLRSCANYRGLGADYYRCLLYTSGEKLRDLAKHHATMVIFLSVGMMDELSATLREEYRPDTPVAVVYKATWEDQKIVRGTLLDIADKVREAGIRKTALTVVGDFLGDEYELSKLYDKTFTHEFRKGVDAS